MKKLVYLLVLIAFLAIGSLSAQDAKTVTQLDAILKYKIETKNLTQLEADAILVNGGDIDIAVSLVFDSYEWDDYLYHTLILDTSYISFKIIDRETNLPIVPEDVELCVDPSLTECTSCLQSQTGYSVTPLWLNPNEENKNCPTYAYTVKLAPNGTLYDHIVITDVVIATKEVRLFDIKLKLKKKREFDILFTDETLDNSIGKNSIKLFGSKEDYVEGIETSIMVWPEAPSNGSQADWFEAPTNRMQKLNGGLRINDNIVIESFEPVKTGYCPYTPVEFYAKVKTPEGKGMQGYNFYVDDPEGNNLSYIQTPALGSKKIYDGITIECINTNHFKIEFTPERYQKLVDEEGHAKVMFGAKSISIPKRDYAKDSAEVQQYILPKLYINPGKAGEDILSAGYGKRQGDKFDTVDFDFSYGDYLWFRNTHVDISAAEALDKSSYEPTTADKKSAISTQEDASWGIMGVRPYGDKGVEGAYTLLQYRTSATNPSIEGVELRLENTSAHFFNQITWNNGCITHTDTVVVNLKPAAPVLDFRNDACQSTLDADVATFYMEASTSTENVEEWEWVIRLEDGSLADPVGVLPGEACLPNDPLTFRPDNFGGGVIYSSETGDYTVDNTINLGGEGKAYGIYNIKVDGSGTQKSRFSVNSVDIEESDNLPENCLMYSRPKTTLGYWMGEYSTQLRYAGTLDRDNNLADGGAQAHLDGSYYKSSGKWVYVRYKTADGIWSNWASTNTGKVVNPCTGEGLDCSSNNIQLGITVYSESEPRICPIGNVARAYVIKDPSGVLTNADTTIKYEERLRFWATSDPAANTLEKLEKGSKIEWQKSTDAGATWQTWATTNGPATAEDRLFYAKGFAPDETYTMKAFLSPFTEVKEDAIYRAVYKDASAEIVSAWCVGGDINVDGNCTGTKIEETVKVQAAKAFDAGQIVARLSGDLSWYTQDKIQTFCNEDLVEFRLNGASPNCEYIWEYSDVLNMMGFYDQELSMTDSDYEKVLKDPYYTPEQNWIFYSEGDVKQNFKIKEDIIQWYLKNRGGLGFDMFTAASEGLDRVFRVKVVSPWNDTLITPEFRIKFYYITPLAIGTISPNRATHSGMCEGTKLEIRAATKEDPINYQLETIFQYSPDLITWYDTCVLTDTKDQMGGNGGTYWELSAHMYLPITSRFDHYYIRSRTTAWGATDGMQFVKPYKYAEDRLPLYCGDTNGDKSALATPRTRSHCKAYSDTLHILVRKRPDAGVIGPDTICKNNTANFVFSGGGNYNTWYYTDAYEVDYPMAAYEDGTAKEVGASIEWDIPSPNTNPVVGSKYYPERFEKIIVYPANTWGTFDTIQTTVINGDGVEVPVFSITPQDTVVCRGSGSEDKLSVTKLYREEGDNGVVPTDEIGILSACGYKLQTIDRVCPEPENIELLLTPAGNVRKVEYYNKNLPDYVPVPADKLDLSTTKTDGIIKIDGSLLQSISPYSNVATNGGTYMFRVTLNTGAAMAVGVDVLPYPYPANLIDIPKDTSICANEAVEFFVKGEDKNQIGEIEYKNYLWKESEDFVDYTEVKDGVDNYNITNNSSETTLEVEADKEFNENKSSHFFRYELTATTKSVNGCLKDTTFNGEITLGVRRKVPSAPTMTLGDTAVCEGNNLVLKPKIFPDGSVRYPFFYEDGYTMQNPDVKYQWYRESGGKEEVLIGENQNTLRLDKIQKSKDGDKYRLNLQITEVGACGSVDLSTKAITLNVNSYPVLAAVDMSESSIPNCLGDQMELIGKTQITLDGAPYLGDLDVFWIRSKNGIEDTIKDGTEDRFEVPAYSYNDATGEFSASLRLTELLASDNGSIYKLGIGAISSCDEYVFGTSPALDLNFVPPFKTEIKDERVCKTNTLVLEATLHQEDKVTSIVWQYTKDTTQENSWQDLADGKFFGTEANIVGATSKSPLRLQIENAVDDIAGFYRIKVTTNFTCQSKDTWYSNISTVLVDFLPNIEVKPKELTIAEDQSESFVAVVSNAEDGNGISSYKWFAKASTDGVYMDLAAFAKAHPGIKLEAADRLLTIKDATAEANELKVKCEVSSNCGTSSSEATLFVKNVPVEHFAINNYTVDKVCEDAIAEVKINTNKVFVSSLRWRIGLEDKENCSTIWQDFVAPNQDIDSLSVEEADHNEYILRFSPASRKYNNAKIVAIFNETSSVQKQISDTIVLKLDLKPYFASCNPQSMAVAMTHSVLVLDQDWRNSTNITYLGSVVQDEPTACSVDPKDPEDGSYTYVIEMLKQGELSYVELVKSNSKDISYLFEPTEAGNYDFRLSVSNSCGSAVAARPVKVVKTVGRSAMNAFYGEDPAKEKEKNQALPWNDPQNTIDSIICEGDNFKLFSPVENLGTIVNKQWFVANGTELIDLTTYGLGNTFQGNVDDKDTLFLTNVPYELNGTRFCFVRFADMPELNDTSIQVILRVRPRTGSMGELEISPKPIQDGGNITLKALVYDKDGKLEPTSNYAEYTFYKKENGVNEVLGKSTDGTYTIANADATVHDQLEVSFKAEGPCQDVASNPSKIEFNPFMVDWVADSICTDLPFKPNEILYSQDKLIAAFDKGVDTKKTKSKEAHYIVCLDKTNTTKHAVLKVAPLEGFSMDDQDGVWSFSSDNGTTFEQINTLTMPEYTLSADKRSLTINVSNSMHGNIYRYDGKSGAEFDVTSDLYLHVATAFDDIKVEGFDNGVHCAPHTYDFKITGINGFAKLEWFVDRKDGKGFQKETADQDAFQITADLPENGTIVRASVTTMCGTEIFDYTIRLTEGIEVSVDIDAGPGTMCQNTSYIFTATPHGAEEDVRFIWYVDGVVADTTNEPKFEFWPPRHGLVKVGVRLLSKIACEGSVSYLTIKESQVDVYSIPDLLVRPHIFDVQFKDSVMLIAEVTFPIDVIDVDYTVSWEPKELLKTPDTNRSWSIEMVDEGEHWFYATITTEQGCVVVDSTAIEVILSYKLDSVETGLVQKPIVEWETPDTMPNVMYYTDSIVVWACPNSELTLRIYSSGGEPPYLYRWVGVDPIYPENFTSPSECDPPVFKFNLDGYNSYFYCQTYDQIGQLRTVRVAINYFEEVLLDSLVAGPHIIDDAFYETQPVIYTAYPEIMSAYNFYKFIDGDIVNEQHSESNKYQTAYKYPDEQNNEVYVTSKDTNGCRSVMHLGVEIRPLPNAMFVDDPEYMDAGVLFPKMEVEIFDSWGRQVKTFDGTLGWDATKGGQKISSGTYYYRVKAPSEIGEIYLQGAVTVFRKK